MPLADDAGRGIDVLVVEDSRVQATAVRLSLLQKEFGVRLAENGAEGLAMMKEQLPDLVISDVEMPEMDGYELCAAIKSDRRLKDTPVILLTALSDPEDIFRGLEVKADNYLTKPWDEELLFSRVQQVLANREVAASRVTKRGVTVIMGRREHNVDADRTQIINLLMSSLDNARHHYDKISAQLEGLQARVDELERENEELRTSTSSSQ